MLTLGVNNTCTPGQSLDLICTLMHSHTCTYTCKYTYRHTDHTHMHAPTNTDIKISNDSNLLFKTVQDTLSLNKQWKCPPPELWEEIR